MEKAIVVVNPSSRKPLLSRQLISLSRQTVLASNREWRGVDMDVSGLFLAKREVHKLVARVCGHVSFDRKEVGMLEVACLMLVHFDSHNVDAVRLVGRLLQVSVFLDLQAVSIQEEDVR